MLWSHHRISTAAYIQSTDSEMASHETNEWDVKWNRKQRAKCECKRRNYVQSNRDAWVTRTREKCAIELRSKSLCCGMLVHHHRHTSMLDASLVVAMHQFPSRLSVFPLFRLPHYTSRLQKIIDNGWIDLWNEYFSVENICIKCHSVWRFLSLTAAAAVVIQTKAENRQIEMCIPWNVPYEFERIQLCDFQTSISDIFLLLAATQSRIEFVWMKFEEWILHSVVVSRLTRLTRSNITIEEFHGMAMLTGSL